MYCLLREDLRLLSRPLKYKLPASQQTWHGQRAHVIFQQVLCRVFAGSLRTVHRLSVKHFWGLNPEAVLKDWYKHSIYILIMSSNLTHVVWLENGFGF